MHGFLTPHPMVLRTSLAGEITGYCACGRGRHDDYKDYGDDGEYDYDYDAGNSDTVVLVIKNTISSDGDADGDAASRMRWQ